MVIIKKLWRVKGKGILIFIGILLFLVIIGVLCLKKVKLTCSDAEDIVLERINGTVVKCELSRKKYEVEVTYQNYHYEFIIDANSGEILEYESDTVD